MRETEVFLGLGSNLGNRAFFLAKAIEKLQAMKIEILASSAVYETEPWGSVPQPNYLNMVVQITSPFSPEELLDITQKIELSMGRTRLKKWSARTIDIDLLYFGQIQLQTEHLTLPHPSLHKRRFVLVPLAEIAPRFKCKSLFYSNLELLAQCDDLLPVWRYEQTLEELIGAHNGTEPILCCDRKAV